MKTSSYNYKSASFGQISELEQKRASEQKIKADKNIENTHAVQLQAGKPAVFQDFIHLRSEMSVYLRVKAGAVVPVSYTHLNVYKRQMSGRRACFSVSGRNADWKKGY